MGSHPMEATPWKPCSWVRLRGNDANVLLDNRRNLRIDFARPFRPHAGRKVACGRKNALRHCIQPSEDKLRAYSNLLGHRRETLPRDILECPRAAD